MYPLQILALVQLDVLETSTTHHETSALWLGSMGCTCGLKFREAHLQ